LKCLILNGNDTAFLYLSLHTKLMFIAFNFSSTLLQKHVHVCRWIAVSCYLSSIHFSFYSPFF